jgi:BirA family biotin operon repressor/biotin-[acetyl-CoA-carboxylase] ligase
MEIKDIQNKLNTKFIGKKFEYYETIASTHLYAKSLKENEIQDGMVILADNQTGGVGTHERKWFTGKGENLSFNIVFTPNCNINKFSKLTYILAECIITILKNLYNIDASIKEPNDIILNGKKMAGIITETSGRGENINRIYIGIGININQTEFSGTLNEIATSLKREFNKKFDRIEILIKFLEEFETKYIKIIEE